MNARVGQQEMDDFARALLAWFDAHGRKNLPWQHPRSAYRVWLSEVMLQQTQVRTVIPYFERFVAELPTLTDLARASEDRVLALWSGLGYYSRARNLHRTAKLCVERHGGDLPRDIDALATLPGIGRSTAAAIVAQAWDEPHAILDGNVRRVLARWHGVRGWPGSAAVQKRLWHFAETHTPRTRCADYTQAIMDLGAMVCVRSRPLCAACPIADGCVARRDGLTHELPQAKPTREKPVRSTTMLLLRDEQGRILLERRPPAGIWARLWSLPETSDATAAHAALGERFHARVRTQTTLASFRHSFTHYYLDIAPLVFEVTRLVRVADDPDIDWYAPAEIEELGLPAPVRALIRSLEPSA